MNMTRVDSLMGNSFIPSDLTGILSWHRSDTVTLNGSDVDEWPDLVNSNDLVAQGSNKADYLEDQVNGHPAFDIQNGGFLYKNALTNAASDYTMMFVFKGNSGGSNPLLYYALNDRNVIFYRIDADGEIGYSDGSGNTASGLTSPTGWSVLIATMSVANGVRFFLNSNTGTFVESWTQKAITPTGADTRVGVFTLWNGTSANLDGLAAEYLLMNREINSDEINSLNSYVSSRYGITIS